MIFPAIAASRMDMTQQMMNQSQMTEANPDMMQKMTEVSEVLLTFNYPLIIFAFIAYFIISLPVGYFCGFVMGWGVVGVWMAFPFGLTSAGLMLWWRFHYMTKQPALRQ